VGSGGHGDDVLVVVNFSASLLNNYVIGLPRDGLWKARLNSDWNGYDPSFGNAQSFDTAASSSSYDGMPFSGVVNIGPYSAIILSQD